ncbi:protein of unknown function [Lactiplantibacillus plantarum]|nr:hypothetical protein predicted by Glimmer/Critica [Lactiplantibacillus plantarum]
MVKLHHYFDSLGINLLLLFSSTFNLHVASKLQRED